MATVQDQNTDLVTIEVDGRELQARKGEMLIEATDRAGIEVPRFCYHHKLTIAANCRMCLVDVEKAPKPLPACATPVGEGMKVFTRSRRAVDAQRGVMEFLLINHPLDCPICDQGGECELQDLAMGYGRSISRFTERKRVVKDKNLGPLVATDMTRCIHCTRCVRFLEEIAGTAELGGVGRGEHLEISTFIERNIDSELSGNIIDLCPVGALTNKPFRFSARAWEMSARPSIGMHDCVGSNLHYHVTRGRIMRSVPRENEDINECWLSDRDRYSHFGLAAPDRLTVPRIKVDGTWQDSDWETALGRAAELLGTVVEKHGAEQLGVLAAPRASCEEHFLLRRLADDLGTPNRDHRLRIADDSDPQLGKAALDRPMRDLSEADAVFMVGSYLRHDQPILNQRVRHAWRSNGAAVMDLNPIAWDFPFDLTERLTTAPQHMVEALAGVAKAAFEIKGAEVPDSELGRLIAARDPEPAQRKVAERLASAKNGFLIVGDQALFHPQASGLRALAGEIAGLLEVALMALPGPANSEGAFESGMLPGENGLAATRQLADGLKGYLLFDLEPKFDTADPAAAANALSAAEAVVAFCAFAGPDLLECADVLLPLAIGPEIDGNYVNADGQRQWFKAAAKPPEASRPGWKILKVLGQRLSLDGYDFSSLAEVNAMMDQAGLPLMTKSRGLEFQSAGQSVLWRAGPVPIYNGDSLLRRAEALQQTDHADNDYIVLNPSTAERLNLKHGDTARVRQSGSEITASLRIDAGLPADTVWLPAATDMASQLGPAWGPIEVEQA
ncbi:MAG: NADH-quinone oxidoreductase subunit NuoG [Wenzhouxiangellaceae bacterium]|nr:NADH-quinone oxidoreductase subunit NuoG [Wenzhouxiangellaceae bacterium]